MSACPSKRSVTQRSERPPGLLDRSTAQQPQSLRLRPGASPNPSFRNLRPASEASSNAKKRNRSSDTAHERKLRQVLWSRGVRFRKNVSTLPGKPDIVIAKSRLVVFCDGDFWHGRHWARLLAELRAGANSSYWIAKIGANRSRDCRNKRLLEKAGWTVLRFWETDIHRNPEQAAHKIEKHVYSSSRGADAIH
jgi:DNA mismatch endonuclease (patch repair protein)